MNEIMNKQLYYFADLSGNNLLQQLAEKAETVLNYNKTVVKIYQKCTRMSNEYSSKHLMELMKLNSQSVISNFTLDPYNSPKQRKASKSPETTSQERSTLVKRIPNVSTLKRKSLPFESAGNEALQIATTIQENQPTPVKVHQIFTKPGIVPKGLFSIYPDNLETNIVSTSRSGKRNPMKINQNTPKTEKCSRRESQLDHLEAVEIDPTFMEFPSPISIQSVEDCPKKDRTVFNSKREVNRKYLNPADQEPAMVSTPKPDNIQLERSKETDEISATSSLKVKVNLFSDKEVEGSFATDEKKNILPKEQGIVSYNRTSFSSEENTMQILQTNKSKKTEFTPIKKSKMSTNSAKTSLQFDNNAETPVFVYKDSKMNISPNQDSNKLKSCEMKSPSTQSSTLLFKSIPRIQSSTAMEIKTDVSCLSLENPCATISRVSSVIYKTTKPVAEEDVDKDRTPKDVSVNEPKPGCSRDKIKLLKSSTTSSLPVVTNRKSPITDDVSYLEEHRSTYELSKTIPMKKRLIKELSPSKMKIMAPPSPTTSFISLGDYRIIKPAIEENTDSDRSPKDVHPSVNEPKSSCSKDNTPSAKSTITISPRATIADVIDLGKDTLSKKSSKRSLPTKNSARSSSPTTEILISCINQLSDQISKRKVIMQEIFNSFIEFCQIIDYIIAHVENIIKVIQRIPMVNRPYVSEDFHKSVFDLITMSSNFIKNLASLKSDVQLDIQVWAGYLRQICEIEIQNKSLVHDGRPLVNIEIFCKYEKNLKANWKTLDYTIKLLDSKILLFLNTDGDILKCISLFLQCLIYVGILKICSTPELYIIKST